ncbi:hypothetical protein BLNAU_7191 [Blattamonas nauphoetae]|uniref:Uncharacterized protein n=1 Tax=Blattamonas nauphoetae TaxID=2049346 RepID=A0ABQ9Y1Y3_9EUKA|nr:hypothetical protein BLNAU_7191 [Blattamonas nauphoetae]
MTRRSRLSRMTPTRFCGLSSDVVNALVAGADEQILGSPPIVQKWIALLCWSFSTRLSLTVTSSTILSPHNSWRPRTMHCDQIIFPNLDFWPSQKHFSFISSKSDAPHIHAIPQPSTIGSLIIKPVEYPLTYYSRSCNQAQTAFRNRRIKATPDDSISQHQVFSA